MTDAKLVRDAKPKPRHRRKRNDGLMDLMWSMQEEAVRDLKARIERLSNEFMTADFVDEGLDVRSGLLLMLAKASMPNGTGMHVKALMDMMMDLRFQLRARREKLNAEMLRGAKLEQGRQLEAEREARLAKKEVSRPVGAVRPAPRPVGIATGGSSA